MDPSVAMEKQRMQLFSIKGRSEAPATTTNYNLSDCSNVDTLGFYSTPVCIATL